MEAAKEIIHHSPSNIKVHHQFEFSGRTGEFFRIWIVNMLLTILTCGIYSAWAKVRTKSYFYSSTLVAGSSFTYLAKPTSILKGRLIALLLMVLFSIATQFAPLLNIALIPALMIATPWMIIKATIFNARMTAWRNVRFNFDGHYGDALVYFLLMPILTLASLGLLYPWVVKKQKQYLVSHHSFGDTAFQPKFTAGNFYEVYLIGFGILALSSLVIPLIPIVGVLIAPLGYILAAAFIVAGKNNFIYGKSHLGDYRFNSTMKAAPLAWIYASNMLAILLTLGLAIPWAMIRLARYRASCMVLVADNALDGFTDKIAEEQSALGEEMADIFDVSAGI